MHYNFCKWLTKYAMIFRRIDKNQVQHIIIFKMCDFLRLIKQIRIISQINQIHIFFSNWFDKFMIISLEISKTHTEAGLQNCLKICFLLFCFCENVLFYRKSKNSQVFVTNCRNIKLPRGYFLNAQLFYMIILHANISQKIRKIHD